MNSNIADNATPHIDELRSRVGQTVESAKSAIADANSAAMETFRNVASSADEYVRENPWVAIGVIAGVAASLGFLAGYMTAPQKSFLASLRR
jgi:ElaB/YqjD/DUF883 family membrane-anchored ribosome-binding protein